MPPLIPPPLPARLQSLLAQVQKALGLTPNMTKVMANSPALLRGYLALSGALSGGVLRPGVRERLAIETAEYNGCEYCLSAHTYIGGHIAKLARAPADPDLKLASVRVGGERDVGDHRA